MTKGGPICDFLAFSALIPLTGGFKSPLFPLAYIIILHVAFYWKLIGGFISSLLFIAVYSIIYFTHPSNDSTHDALIYICQVIFLLLIGSLGGVIVTRERRQHFEKNRLAEAANRDYLTNLYNHRSFQEILRNNIENGVNFFLSLTDIDKFKCINDKYGHVTGDKVLRGIGEIMTSVIPAKLGKVFRYGGEEFAIIIYSNDKAEVEKLLVEIKQAVANYEFHCGEESFSVTMSFGCCNYNGEKPSELVEKADKLLYHAKNTGRNKIVFSLEEMVQVG